MRLRRVLAIAIVFRLIGTAEARPALSERHECHRRPGTPRNTQDGKLG